jgi:hypothetical protein
MTRASCSSAEETYGAQLPDSSHINRLLALRSDTLDEVCVDKLRQSTYCAQYKSLDKQ